MTLSEFKKHLSTAKSLAFKQINGEHVPAHFHITEVGLITKHFIDCGGVIHTNTSINFQIWVANDVEHRLRPITLLNIIDMSQPIIGDIDAEIEVEYQTDTIGKYGLALAEDCFILTATHTDCLAQVRCDLPQAKKKVSLGSLVVNKETVLETNNNSCCTPGGGCC